MSSPSLLDMQNVINAADTSRLTDVSVAVLRNIMVEPAETPYRYRGITDDLNIRMAFGEYDNIYQEAVGGADMLTADTDVCLVFMYLETVSWELARAYPGLSPERIAEETDRITALVDQVVGGIRSQSPAMIIWHGFEMPTAPAYGIYDSQIQEGQGAAITELNRRVRDILAKTNNAYFLDMSLCLARTGAEAFYDDRSWHRGRAPYGFGGLDAIAAEGMKFIRALKGKQCKCLVLDCDNTLWGGIIGEDGLAGIKLGKDYPGSCYYEFQQEIKALSERGIILALCSKNNEADVLEVLRDHPAMLLGEKDIAAAQINWDDKATNLRRIAEDLNIGLESLVFMDDSEFEIGLVRQELPMVKAVLLPKANPSAYRPLLASLGLFDTLTVTGEDRKRGAMYKAEADRKKLKARTPDMDTYYASLEMEVHIHKADEFAVPRIAQQTQKTNQFNLTTRRYSEEDVKRFAEDDGHDVIYLRLVDKFGDSGIVGTCILEYEDTTARIDSFLLSCRVLGRKLEDVFLGQALTLAKRRGAEAVVGAYIKTRKNSQVESFYQDRGFTPLPAQENEQRFIYLLDAPFENPPAFYKEIISTLNED